MSAPLHIGLLLFTGSGIAVLVALATVLVAGSTAGTNDQAGFILVNTAAMYRNCSQYFDTGSIATTIVEGNHLFREEFSFSTTFIRSKQLRFEGEAFISSTERQSVVIRYDGHSVWTSANPRERERRANSLSSAIARFAGICPAAHTIPALLLPSEVGGRSITELRNPELLAEEIVAGFRCLRVKGSYAEHMTTLWIDAKNHALRRIEEVTVIARTRTTDVTTYTPSLPV